MVECLLETHCIVSILTMLRAGRSGVRIPVEARGSSPLHIYPTGSAADLASCSMGTGISFPGGKALRDLMLIARLYIVPTLRMTGALPLLPLHVFIACVTRTISTNCTIPYHVRCVCGTLRTRK